ncbi:MAG: MerR family transcriptional regulator [Thermoleophilia bacterium]|nr:MerR family transcriptional regulator [Thermoleophilia bacterium]MCZ4496291.1 MerR family transcriptional regulator [Thermoleophilia bacterium]
MTPPQITRLLSIGMVATHVGVHPQTLREYERQGLVMPQRTPGGTRRYGPAELDRLMRIQRLTSEGLSLAGVRYVLELEDELREARRRIAELEVHELHHSVSLELVHVPRARRSPRWRNQD